MLILIRGLPGSGKTTMAKTFELAGFVHFEADQYFSRSGEYIFKAEDIPKAHAWCLESACKYLACGNDVVVSNTFTRKWEIEPYIRAARNMHVDVRVIEATGAFQNVHGVPAEAIERMRSRWEPLEA